MWVAILDHKNSIMKKGIIYLLLGLLLPISSIFANDGLHSINPKTATPTKADNLENWLEGRLIGDALLINFNISQVEFNALIDQEDISKITVDFFWKTMEGDSVAPVASVVLENISYLYDIESWSYEITPVDTNGYYMAQVALNEAECGPRVEIPIVKDVYEEEDPVIVIDGDTINLPFYECGDTLEEIVISTELLQREDLGLLFFIGGFPIYLDSGVEGDNGTYSGTGIIPLPFKKQVIKVEFNDVRVDKKHQIFEGKVIALSDNPALYPDFKLSVDTFNIGGDICQEPPLDTLNIAQYGFDPVTGLMPDGSKYNDEGYYVGKDENGNNIFLHKETDTPFNTCGCNIDEKGGEYKGVTYVCQPNCNTNEKAAAFAAAIKNSLADSIANIIADLKIATQDSLANLNCNAIRTEMRDLVNTLGYDSIFIFGVGSKLLKKGMHLEFEKNPKASTVNVERRAEAPALEQRHVDLFHCDKTEYELEATLAALDALANNTSLSEEILAKIKAWSTYAADKYVDNPAAFSAWLKRQIEELIDEGSGINGISAVSPMLQNPSHPFQPRERWGAAPVNQRKANKELKSLFQYDRGYSTHNTTAAANSNAFFNESFTIEDAAFEYLQGAAWINGVERVYYIEALVKQQFFNPSKRADHLQPVVVEKRDSVNNRTIAIYLDSIVFTPNGATLDAYALIEDGESGRKLSFRGKRLHFGPSGLKGESNLSLGVDVQIRLNNSAMLVIEGTPQTNLAWDCNGFKSVNIDAYVEICRKKIIPLDPKTLDTIVGDESNYRLDFDVQEITGWLEFCAKVEAPPFVVRNAPTIKWGISKMFLDFSSTETPKFTPMTGYESPFYDGKMMAPAWKGFYVESLTATLPKSLFNPKDDSGGNTTAIEASDILIDGNGFTGGVGYSGDILSIDDGSIAGWPFSITAINVRVLNNRLAGGGMEGQIQVPLFEDTLGYEAVIYPGDQYSFTVSIDSSLTAPLFLAEVELNGDSKVEIGKIDGEFTAKATLSGRLEIDGAKDANAPLQLGLTKMCFQGFEVSNKSPYFSPGTWGIVKDTSRASNFKPDAGGFGIKVDNLLPYNPGEGKIGLGFDVGVVLNEEFDIAAEGSLGIEGRLEETNGRQKWVYDGLHISKLAVDASFPGASIKGVVEWFDDGKADCIDTKTNVCWGKGFRGALEAKFKKFKTGIEAVAHFGKKDEYKYFYVDALAELGFGIPIGPAIQLSGFGGGISYKMTTIQEEVKFFGNGNNNDLPAIGGSFSGTKYIPSKSAGLGLKAAVVLSSIRDEIFNGTASMQFIFNGNNGFDKISFAGSGQFLSPIDLGNLVPSIELPSGEVIRPTNFTSAVSAYLNLDMNFASNSLDGSYEVFLNVGNGDYTILSGTGNDGKMVDAAMHFGPDGWYIHMGRPYEGKTCGVEFNLLGIKRYSESYWQVGTLTDPMRPLPSKVASIAYKINRNESLRTSGAGFVIGASSGFALEASIAKIVSATLEAEFGYDVMLRKYKGVSCENSDQPIGINGWYAAGQMYAYAYGKLKVFGVNIAEAGIAAVLQARLPNPFFAQATVGVKVKVGPFKAKKSLKLTLGKDCNLVANDPDDELGMEVISNLNPSDQEANVETNAQPEATFALSLDRNYDITGLGTNSNQYKVRLIETNLINSEGRSIGHYFLLNEDRTSLKAIPNNTFNANDSVTFSVTVRIFKNGDFLTDETKQVTFATADALNYIPETNVKAAYPANGMVNFYRNEYNRQEGYISLVTGQSELFDNLPEGTSQFMRLTSASGMEQTMSFRYEDSANRITFPLNGNQLQAGELYQLELIQSTGNTPINTSPPDETPNTTDNVSVGNPAASVLYALYFRVSEYATFSAKIDAVLSNQVLSFEGILRYKGTELFDNLETDGNSKHEALIDFEVDLDHSWLREVKRRFEKLEEESHCSVSNYPAFEDLKFSAGISSSNLIMDANNFNAGTLYTNNGKQFLSFELGRLVTSFYDLRKTAIYACGGGDADSFYADCIDANAGGGQEEEVCNQRLAEINRGYSAFPSNTAFKGWVSYSLPGGITTTTKAITFTKKNFGGSN